MRNLSKKYWQKKNLNTSSGKKRQFNVRSEILGLVFLSVGILLSLALISYHANDPTGKLLTDNPYKVKNFLGIAGAIISSPVFQFTFGYPSLVFPIILIIIGITYMIGDPLKKMIKPSVLLFLWAFLISIIIALPASIKTMGYTHIYYPSGLLGGLWADTSIRIFGNFASVFFVFLFFVILSILTFRIRFSIIPIYLFRFFKSTIELVVKLFGLLAKLPNALIIKIKSLNKRKAKIKYDTSEPEIKIKQSAISSTEYKQPEEIQTEEIQKENVEIIKPERSKFDIPPLDKDEILEEEQMMEVEESESKDVTIEEAVQEKELDYDTLVRDSLAKYQFPSIELLNEDPEESKISKEELLSNARLLEQTLGHFGVKATVKKVVEGPVITLYAVQPAEGVKITQIVSLTDDLALAMRAKGIRMIAPIPGEAAIGVEIPNRHPSTVYFSSIVRSEKYIQTDGELILGMGKTISGEIYTADLTKMPHLLMAGSTGSGKSVGINTIIASILYRVPPSDVKFVMIDPKKLELTLYAKLRDHYLAICPELDEIVITHPQNAILILRSVVNEMEERYDKLAHLGVRDIVSYNKKAQEYKDAGEKSDEFRKLPYLIVVIDELADLILTAAREVEEPITRLAQMARAVGIHLIIATQRPSVDILTGLIKANFPTRIAYQVATRPDSKVILDIYGAEKMIGNGDMLFLPPGVGKPIRLQNPLITTEEVDRLIKHIRKQPKFPPYELKLIRTSKSLGSNSINAFERDELFEQAKEIVIRHQQGSISLLQRKLKIGYARAARLVDELEEAGVVGPGQGSKARDVLISAYTDE
jgi:S-DNA-T family DNA segregation ATPase FtsK/SpoIIIE